MKLGHIDMMLHVGPSFVLYALLLDPGCCLRAQFELDGQFELEKKKYACQGRHFGTQGAVQYRAGVVSRASRHLSPHCHPVPWPEKLLCLVCLLRLRVGLNVFASAQCIVCNGSNIFRNIQ